MFLIKILKKDKEEISKFDSDLRDFNDVSIKHIIWTSANWISSNIFNNVCSWNSCKLFKYH